MENRKTEYLSKRCIVGKWLPEHFSMAPGFILGSGEKENNIVQLNTFDRSSIGFNILKEIDFHENIIYDIVIAQDGKILITTDKYLKYYKLQTNGDMILNENIHVDLKYGRMKISSIDNIVIADSFDGHVVVIDLNNEEVVFENISCFSYTCIEFLSKSIFVCGTVSGMIEIYDIEAQELIHRVSLLSDIITDIICIDVTKFLAATNFGKVFLFDILNLESKVTIFEGNSCITKMSRLRDAIFLATASEGVVQLTDLVSDNVKAEIIFKYFTSLSNSDVNAVSDELLLVGDDQSVHVLQI
eukprot:TRINITY_DN2561_c0_g1_i1.p1 TRINITY_DN2561_c0_g1~~TRINITY_DN2561_c0_g1_i1.p1  ORF type:complete len:300 (+),score=62.46 TRINITY_DN2561_c0_g1_i1:82-981(+)